MKRKNYTTKNSKFLLSYKKHLETPEMENIDKIQLLIKHKDQLLGKKVSLDIKLNFPNRQIFDRNNFLYSLDSIIKTTRATIYIQNEIKSLESNGPSLEKSEIDSLYKNHKKILVNTTEQVDKAISEIRSYGNDLIKKLDNNRSDWIELSKKLLQSLYSLKKEYFQPKKSTIKEIQELLKSTGYSIIYPKIDYETTCIIVRPDNTEYVIKFNKNIITRSHLKKLIQQNGIENLESLRIKSAFRTGKI